MKRIGKFSWRELTNRVHNYFLVKRYPFLRPSCGWSVDMTYWPKDYKYRYEETWLDSVPNGWRELVLRLCKELKQIIKEDHLNDYAIHQVKEKFGELRWYTEGGNERTQEITNKYEALSRNTCMYCGKTPTTHITKGWITYICSDCAKKRDPEKIVAKKNDM